MRNATTGRRGRKIFVVAAAAILVVAVGVAYAAWTAGGSGSGYAKATTAQAPHHGRRLSHHFGDAVPRRDRRPRAQGSITPNPYPVRVTSVSGSGAIASDKGAACDASTGVVFTDQTGLTPTCQLRARSRSRSPARSR